MSINFFFHIIRFFQCGKNRDFVEIFIHIFAMPVKDQIPGDNKQQTFKMVIFTKKFTRFPYFDKDFLYYFFGSIGTGQIEATEIIDLFPVLFIQSSKCVFAALLQQ